MLLMIDNYDSFTYNLVQYFGELGKAVTTNRNDQATLDELIELKPDHVVVSPGPCDPDQAGISLKAIEYFAEKYRYWECVSGIKQLVKHSVEKSYVLRK